MAYSYGINAMSPGIGGIPARPNGINTPPRDTLDKANNKHRTESASKLENSPSVDNPADAAPQPIIGGDALCAHRQAKAAPLAVSGRIDVA